jgi:hypothetical protein
MLALCRGTMPEDERPAARYRRLASQCLEVASTFPPSEQRTALLHMAQVWQRLADLDADSTPPLFQPGTGELPTMQQQQLQPDDDKKDAAAKWSASCFS